MKRSYRYDEAISETTQAIAKAIEDNNVEILVQLELERASLYRITGQYDSALINLEKIVNSKGTFLSNNRELLAQLYFENGANHIHKGELLKGKESIHKSIKYYKSSSRYNDTLLVQCYNILGNYHLYKKKYDSALCYYQLSHSLNLKKRDNKKDIPNYLINLSIGYYFNQEYTKSENLLLEAIDLILEYQPNNFYLLCKAYSNLGLLYYNLSAYNRSLTNFIKAEEVAIHYNDNGHLDLGNLTWNKAILYLGLGDVNKAENYIHQARQIYEERFSKNNTIFSALNMDHALIYEALGQTDKAVEMYRLSLQNSALPVRLKTYRNLARLYMGKEELEESRKYFDTCYSIINSEEINSIELAYTDLYYGEFLIKTGSKSAIKSLNNAFELFIENFGIKHRDVAKVLGLMGDYYRKHNKPDLALYYYHQGAISINPGFHNAEVLSNPEPSEVSIDQQTIRIFESKAQTLRTLYECDKKVEVLVSLMELYDLMVYSAEQFIRMYRTEEGRMLLWEEFHQIYKQAIEVCFMAYEVFGDPLYLEKAFNLSEKTKASILLAELRDDNAKNLGLVPEDLYQLEKSLRGNMYMYKSNILKEEDLEFPNEGKLAFMRSRLFEDEKRYDSLLNVFEKKFPDYYKLKFNPSVNSIAEIQRLIENDEQILEYTITDNFLVLFLISNKEFFAIKKPLDADMVCKIYALRDNLIIPRADQYTYKDYLSYQTLAFDLYNTLVDPVRDKLTGKYIIVIPDGELAYLSFESLIDSTINSTEINFRDLPFLIHHFTFSYESSATIFSIGEKSGNPRIRKGVLSMAPSYPLVKRSIVQEYGEDFGGILHANRDLPGASWEAEMILKIIPGDKLLGEEATETNFKQIAGNYDILHFAMHTSIDDAHPLSSKMSFYPLDEPPEDDVLHTYEIYNMKLNGYMAVLSACSTGSGKLQKGEGVISLARAFAFAGMPCVVMTLWDVEDITSCYIVPDFYNILSKGFRKDQSLRLSKLNYIQTAAREIEAHPAFWAGFVIYGNKKPFRQTKLEIYFILLAILGVLLVITSAVLIRRYIEFKRTQRNISQYLDTSHQFQSKDRV
jgi:CHAT domain-containing protein